MPAPRCFALVPCAGAGTRAGPGGAKQYRPLAGRPLVMHTLAALARVARIDGVLVVVARGDGFLQPHANAPGARFSLARCGGATRAASVFNGLSALRARGAAADDWVLVHDAARCLVTPADVDALIDACAADAVGGLLALPLPDTLKAANERARVVATLPRADKWLAQTPQMFRLGALHAALVAHEARGFAGITDEASAIEAAGGAPLLVRGAAHNVKVTYPEDFALADAVLRSRGA